MQKTFYITPEAWEIIKDMKNKSRFVNELILNSHSECTELARIADLLECAINVHGKISFNTSENKANESVSEIKEAINQIIGM